MSEAARADFTDAIKQVDTPDSFARALLAHVLRAAPEKVKASGGESVEFTARIRVARPFTHTSAGRDSVCICTTVDDWEVCVCVEV
ncbi:hypothetical protein ACFY5C_02845 [Streptomyces sp. NPDC012935]|uniref:hypothetical protein n=1 Tax=Streptomyces sp. NPDC012935 TaxID=3364857 RepID=UPI0036A6099D